MTESSWLAEVVGGAEVSFFAFAMVLMDGLGKAKVKGFGGFCETFCV